MSTETIAELKRQLEVAQRGITYALNRIQTDPDVRYYCGAGTEMFSRLVDAEAAITGRDRDELVNERSKDCQPPHRRREPDVVVLRDKLEEAQRGWKPAKDVG